MEIQELRAEIIKEEILKEIDYQRKLDRMKDYLAEQDRRRERLDRLRRDAIKRARVKLKRASRKKDYKEVRKVTKELNSMSKQAKIIKRLDRADQKLIARIVRTRKISKRIERRLHRMAMREATATGFIQSKIARFQNRVDRVKMIGDRVKSKYNKYRLNRAVKKHNKLTKKESWKDLKRIDKKEFAQQQEDHRKRALEKRAKEAQAKEVDPKEALEYAKKKMAEKNRVLTPTQERMNYYKSPPPSAMSSLSKKQREPER